MKPGPKACDPEERFLALMKIDEMTGCWMWQGTRNNNGYGLFYVAPGKVMTAHRWAYLHWKGPIPKGQDLDHDCHNRDSSCLGGKTDPHRMCARPEHLIPATRSENLLRGAQSANAKSGLHVRELGRARSARYRARKRAAGA